MIELSWLIPADVQESCLAREDLHSDLDGLEMLNLRGADKAAEAGRNEGEGSHGLTGLLSRNR